MKLGFHISTAGGFKNVVPRAIERNCTSIQIFSRNPRQWNYKALELADVAKFKDSVREHGIAPIFVHMPYIVNLASVDTELFNRSIESLAIELKRSEQLGAHYVILHAGSSDDTNIGIQRMAKGIRQALNDVRNDIVLLVENTPGSGKEFGDRFEDIADIMTRCKQGDRIGMAFDTAHAHAAGYDMHTNKGVKNTITELDAVIGIEHVHVIHFNDSRYPCGSLRDRHEHIGKGTIGTGMRYILCHPLLSAKPFIMETPRMNIKDDMRNLKTVKGYLKSTPSPS